LPASGPWWARAEPARPAGKAQLTRSDFGISYNAALETGGVLVSDEITLEFDISAVRS